MLVSVYGYERMHHVCLMLMSDCQCCIMQALQVAGEQRKLCRTRPVHSMGIVRQSSCCLCFRQLMLPAILPGRQNPIRYAAISR